MSDTKEATVEPISSVPVLSKQTIIGFSLGLIISLVGLGVLVGVSFAGLRAQVGANTSALASLSDSIDDLTSLLNGSIGDRLRAAESNIQVLQANFHAHQGNHPSIQIWPAVEALEERYERLLERLSSIE
jgi:hypothetical protein